MQMTFLFAETHLAMYPKPIREWYSKAHISGKKQNTAGKGHSEHFPIQFFVTWIQI